MGFDSTDGTLIQNTDDPVQRLDATNHSAGRTRPCSVEQIQSLLRASEGATQSSQESSVLQKILTEKISDQYANLMKQTAVCTYDSQLSDVVQATQQKLANIHDTITTPPKRLALRVPWEVARLSIKASSVVASSVFQPETPRDPGMHTIEELRPDGNRSDPTGTSEKKE